MLKGYSSKRNRNGYIELLRFVASLFIALFHADFAPSGWIWTEFFFMLSGYFAFKMIMSNRINGDANAPMIYTWGMIKKIFPYTAVAMIAMFFVRIYKWELSVGDVISYSGSLLENLTMLNGTGLIRPYYSINEKITVGEMFLGPIWYISALIIAMPIMIYLVQQFYSKVGVWMVSFLPLLIDGYIVIKSGTIQGWHMDMLSFITLDFRALAGLLFGGGIYCMVRKIEKLSFSKAGKVILLFVEWGALVVICAMSFEKSISNILIMLTTIIIALTISLSEKTITGSIHFGVCDWLGKLSLPIFCSHCLVIEAVGCANAVVYLMEVIVVGAILEIIVRLIKKIEIINGIKKLMIERL